MQATPAQPGVEREIVTPPTPRPTFGERFPQTRGTPLANERLPIKQDSHGNVEIDWSAADAALRGIQLGVPTKKTIIDKTTGKRITVAVEPGETVEFGTIAGDTKPVYRRTRDGHLVKLGDVPANAVVTDEPRPVTVNVNTGAPPTPEAGASQDEYTAKIFPGPRGLPQTRWYGKTSKAWYTEEQMRARAGTGDQKAAIAIGTGGKTTRNPALIRRDLIVNTKKLQAARVRKDPKGIAEAENAQIDLEAEMEAAVTQRPPTKPAPTPPAPARPIVPTPPAKPGAVDPNAPPLDPKVNKGVTKRNTQTGDTYYSDGTQWIKQ